MPTDDLVTALVDAARAAFTELREQHPDETFYCFALYTDEAGAHISQTCNSEEGLHQAAREYHEQYGKPVEEYAQSLRWNPADWPYHMLGEEHFDAAQDLLWRRGPHPFDLDDDLYEAEVAARFEAFTRAIRRLDEEGFFGRGAGREQVIVAVLHDDQEEDSLLQTIRALNPLTVVQWLEREMALME